MSLFPGMYDYEKNNKVKGTWPLSILLSLLLFTFPVCLEVKLEFAEENLQPRGDEGTNNFSYTSQ